MSPPEPSESDAAAASEAGGPRFVIQKIYVKDSSFESPRAPEVFRVEWKPEIDLRVQNDAKRVGENNYEVAISVTATVTINEQTAFLVEVVQAGLFEIRDFSDEDLKSLLGSSCPGILFPYAREAVSDLVSRGGFPQLLLAPVNFDVLYHRHLEQQAATTGDSSG